MTRRRIRLSLLCASLTLVASAGLAAAKPVAGRPVPPPEDLSFAPAPRGLEIVESDSKYVELHILERSDEIMACSKHSRATFARLRVRLAWNGRGIIRTVGVTGGSAAYNRCVGRVLRGAVPTKVFRAGRGTAQIVVRPSRPTPRPLPRPTPRPILPDPKPLPAPSPSPLTKLQQCKVDTDCAIHFQTSACVASDPVAVSRAADGSAVQAAFPVRRLACGMGGPQYDKLRMENEGRWSAACERSRCVVVDAGPRPSVLDL